MKSGSKKKTSKFWDVLGYIGIILGIIGIILVILKILGFLWEWKYKKRWT